MKQFVIVSGNVISACDKYDLQILNLICLLTPKNLPISASS